MSSQSQLFWYAFRLKGRISRTAYLLGYMLIVVAQLWCFYRIMRAAPGMSAEELLQRLMSGVPANPGQLFWMEVLTVVALASILPTVAITVKRLHDINLPGIGAVAAFIPPINLMTFFVLCAWPGTPGPNKYGSQTNSDA